MLTQSQIKEIREHLQKAQNPVFFFDNDADGLCSFLLLRRYLNRGKGVVIKSFPDLNQSYTRKINELNPDYVFILDKPIVSEDFLKESKEKNLPVVWIDHHNVSKPDFEDTLFYYYNSMINEKPSSEPVTYWTYKITNNKEDLWLAMCGCIGDGFLPEFSEEVKEKYPNLWGDVNTAFEGLYNTQLGKITQILNFALKDRTSNVVRMMKTMFKAKPEDVLEESKKNTMLIRFEQINEKYRKLVMKAENFVRKSKLLFFQYGGELSISADISNELFYKHPDKIVVVAYIKGTKANISIRGSNDVREMTLKAISGIEGATGGGHKNATGAKMNVEDLPKFKENLDRMIGR